ncbi:hypothetical protein PENTCL1PPCAC_16236, partial [Pristionchus entomophagus]
VEDREGSMLFVFLGPCSLISEHVCRLCQASHLHLVNQSTIILLQSFAFRLYILVAHYLVQTNVPIEVMRRLRLLGYTASHFDPIGSTRAILVVIVDLVLSPVVMTFIFVVRRKLIMRIAQAISLLRLEIMKSLKALTYQTMLPCGVAIGGTLYLLDATQIWSNEFSERFMMIVLLVLISQTCSIFSLASPLINFTVLPPYRALVPF